MKKIYKIVILISLFVVLTANLVSKYTYTKTHKSYTYTPGFGSTIRITIKTTGNYDITPGGPFRITKNGEKVVEGSFHRAETYKESQTDFKEDPRAELIKSWIKNGNEYLYWVYDKKEYNYAVTVKGSNTSIYMYSKVSKEETEKLFSRLEFELVK